jgi:fibronectin type 3 domain-containing protein
LLLMVFLLYSPDTRGQSVALRWNPTAGANEYRVYRRDTPTGTFNHVATAQDTQYVDTSVTRGLTYFWVVTAANANGESPRSDEVSATIPGTMPSPPLPASGVESGTACVSVTGVMTAGGEFNPQSGRFTATYEATPAAAPTYAVVGLASTAATLHAQLAVITRFDSASGRIDARNGSAYQATNPVSYVAGTTYRFRLAVDIPARRYNAWVSWTGMPEVQIASNYAFRTEQLAEQSTVTSLSHWRTISNIGGQTVCNFALAEVPPPPPPPPPVTISVSPSAVTLLTGSGQTFTAAVSNATDSAVTWTATGGTIISTSANTAFYSAPPAAGAFTITATSAADATTTATATVTVNPPPPPPPKTLSCTGSADTVGDSITSIRIECK